MKNFLLASVVLLLVSGCSGFREKTTTDPWIGRSEEQVIDQMGVPARSYETADKKYMVYTASSYGRPVGFGTTYVVTSMGYVFPVAGNTAYNGYTGTCETIFVINDGEVESWRSNNCR